MGPVKIKYVVSFTSQDPKNTVGNLSCVDGNNRSWLCNPHDHSGVLRAELQLEHATYIGYVDVGNCGSAFIQIDVGRSSWPVDHPYTTLLPTATLMSPTESRQGIGRTGVRMFKKGDFLSEGAEDSWDRVRVTCTQPFNRRAQFGLSFLRIRSPQVENEGVSTKEMSQGNKGQKTPEKTVSDVREWLSSPAVQKNFFRGMKGMGISKKAQTSVGLSRTARMVLKATQATRNPSSKPLCSTPSGAPNTATSPSAKAGSSSPSSAKTDALTRNIHPHSASKAFLISALSTENKPHRQLKRKPNSKTRQNLLNTTPCFKQRKCHTSQEAEDSGDIETTCPLCGEFFTAEYLPLHASSCQGTDTVCLPGVMTASLSLSQETPSSPGDDMLPCPLCSFRFPASHIQLHASSCGDLVDSPFIWVD